MAWMAYLCYTREVSSIFGYTHVDVLILVYAPGAVSPDYFIADGKRKSVTGVSV